MSEVIQFLKEHPQQHYYAEGARLVEIFWETLPDGSKFLEFSLEEQLIYFYMWAENMKDLHKN